MNRRKKPSRPKSKNWVLSVYLPSEKMKREWEKEADKHGIPMTRFVINAVEFYFEKKARENTGVPRYELVSELKAARKENDELHKENHRLKLLTESLEKELALQRFDRSREELMKVRRPDRRLIYALRNSGGMTNQEILAELGVSELAEKSIITSINTDLETLEQAGVIMFDGSKWRWNIG